MKNILITGSTDGIGKSAAIELAKDGHSVILHGRDPQKLSDTTEELRKTAKEGSIMGIVADFSDLRSVTEMAHKLKDEVPVIDVVINNAGIFKSWESLNNNGLDIRYVVNYLSPFLLTNELIPLLKKADSPRIINVSSAAQSSINYEVFTGKKIESEGESYAQSKLALTMWSFRLAKKHRDLSVLAVNPGSLLNTKMVKEAYGTYWSSADKGSSILYDLAVSEKYDGITGKYFDNDKGSFGQAHADAYDDSKIDKLVIETTRLLSSYT